MPFANFIIQSILISLSGVMAPGPMTAATVGLGGRSPYAGMMVAVGHGIVELPLMAAIFFGLGRYMDSTPVRTALGILGGLFMLIMAAGMLRSIGTSESGSKRASRSALISGILLSAGNPYFIVWWFVVGSTLIIQSSGFGLKGLVVFAAAHWSCDFMWYTLLSAVSYRGGLLLGKKFQQVIAYACILLLVYFGGRFIYDGASTFLTRG